jgi:acetyltransferase
MADYPTRLVQEHTLFDGRRVLIRPVREDDDTLERAFLSDLSGDSRYLRFQKWVKLPSDKLVAFLTHVDHDRHLALVCIARSGPAQEIVGEARYVVNAEGKSCDFAIVIADGWHKSGIAGLLMNALIGAARERGLATMESQVLTCNTEMLRFAHGLGFEVQHVPDDMTTVRIVKALQANARERLGRRASSALVTKSESGSCQT